MKKELITLYKKLLFNVPQTTPTLKTYAIVDSIRDEAVKEKILFSQLNHTDLWHEELFENEQEVPLYLIELEKDNDLLDYLLSKHKESIATYFISPYSIETLQAYYSRFTHVNIEVEKENFQKGIFGFYDPNVLSNYIQTLYTQEKIDEFFIGAAMWLAPSVEKADELYIAYRTKEAAVEDVNLQLKHFIKEEHPMIDFDDVSLPTLANLEAYTHEVFIDQIQIAMFDEMEKMKFIDNIFKAYKEEGHQFYHPETFNKELALKLFDEAKSLNIVSEAGIYRYILLGLTVLKPMKELKLYHDIVNTENEESKIRIMDDFMNKILEKRRETNGI